MSLISSYSYHLKGGLINKIENLTILNNQAERKHNQADVNI